MQSVSTVFISYVEKAMNFYIKLTEKVKKVMNIEGTSCKFLISNISDHSKMPACSTSINAVHESFFQNNSQCQNYFPISPISSKFKLVFYQMSFYYDLDSSEDKLAENGDDLEKLF